METDVVELIKQYGVGTLALVLTLCASVWGYVRIKVQRLKFDTLESDLDTLESDLKVHLIECTKANEDLMTELKEVRSEMKDDRGKLHERIDNLSKSVNQMIGKVSGLSEA